MRLTFVHTPQFVDDWKHLQLSDDDLRALENELLQKPEAGRTVPQAGGVRKMRFAPPAWHGGKSGATRLIYAYFPAHSTLYTLIAYGKNEQANLTADEKKACKKLMKEISDYLNRSTP